MRDGKIIVARLWPKFGGNIPSVIPVILGINPQKYETIGIYLTKNSDIPNLLEQNGKKIFFVTQKPKLPIIRPMAFFKLAQILKNQGVDILHCHHHISTVYGTIAGRLAKTPVILSHVHGLGRTRNIRRKLVNRFILPKIDRILTVSEAVKNDVLQNNTFLPLVKVINLGNSIDYDYFASAVYDKQTVRKKFNVPLDSFVFATAGRLAATKGQEYLLEAFAGVVKKFNNAQLLIAGEGELKNELEKQVSSFGCKANIRFLGQVDNMPEFYRAIDTFVLPSIAEGLPRTLLEAIVSGVFCITSNVGGIPEILDNGRFGLLVPPKDTNALANAMLAAVNMPQQEKSAIISAAKEHIKINYSHNCLIKKVEKIYDALVVEKIRHTGKEVYIFIGHGFGDNLMATAVIAGIKKEYPDTRIFVLTKRRWEVFENNPNVAACYNARKMMKKFPEIYKKAILLSEYTYADFRNAKEVKHMIDRMYDLIGINVQNRIYQPEIYLTQKELDYRHCRLQRLSRPLVAVAPSGKITTKIPNKFYAIEKWLRLAALLKKANITVIQVGDKREGPLLEGARNWRNLGYRKTASVLRHCDAIITHVSGIMHLATAVGTPCITIYGGTEDPLVSGYPCNINITTDLPCSPCWLEKPCDKPVCKDMLTPELIMEKLNELLNSR
ncbi:MAG: glycosyltransferase [Sedimentisphaerales bacterium]